MKRIAKEVEKMKKKEVKERKEMKNAKVASQKAVSVILRREATKAIIDKRRKKGPVNSKKLLPRTLLEALNERISAFRWESALKVSLFLSSSVFLDELNVAGYLDFNKMLFGFHVSLRKWICGCVFVHCLVSWVFVLVQRHRGRRI